MRELLINGSSLSSGVSIEELSKCNNIVCRFCLLFEGRLIGLSYESDMSKIASS